MKRKLAYIIFLFVCLPVASQRVDLAQELFNNGQYAEAGEIYQALLKQNPRNELNNYRYACCSYELGDMETARKHFEISGTRYPLKNFYLGEIYSADYKFDKSIEAYGKYLPTLVSDDERIPEIEKKIKQAELAKRLLLRVEDIAVIDSMTVDKKDFLSYYRFSSELGSLKQTRVTMDSLRGEDKITYTTQRKDRMYFSDSIGGQMDIFTSYRLLDTWSPPQPFSKMINSAANENYPFLLLDGVTMYFASDGENSMGGYDIFITKYIPSNNTYLTPENIGMPFNSPFNDYMLVMDETNNTGWFATDRYQADDKVCLYFFVPNESKILLQSENAEDIRRIAQLKTFRRAEIPEFSRINQAPESSGENQKKFSFIVTDKLIYTQPEQFKSEEALKAWQDLDKLNAQSENMKEQLNSLRKNYEKAKNEAERAVIIPKILILEREIQEQDELIQQKNINVRNEEIKFLQGKSGK